MPYVATSLAPGSRGCITYLPDNGIANGTSKIPAMHITPSLSTLTISGVATAAFNALDLIKSSSVSGYNTLDSTAQKAFNLNNKYSMSSEMTSLYTIAIGNFIVSIPLTLINPFFVEESDSLPFQGLSSGPGYSISVGTITGVTSAANVSVNWAVTPTGSMDSESASEALAPAKYFISHNLTCGGNGGNDSCSVNANPNRRVTVVGMHGTAVITKASITSLQSAEAGVVQVTAFSDCTAANTAMLTSLALGGGLPPATMKGFVYAVNVSIPADAGSTSDGEKFSNLITMSSNADITGWVWESVQYQISEGRIMEIPCV